MRADKQKVTDEIWDDERVKSFLNPRSAIAGDAADFTLLLMAYQGMRPADFDRFIAFFVAENHDLNATNELIETVVDDGATHRNAAPGVATMMSTPLRSLLICGRLLTPP